MARKWFCLKRGWDDAAKSWLSCPWEAAEAGPVERRPDARSGRCGDGQGTLRKRRNEWIYR